MILSHSLARLERLRSNLPPTGGKNLNHVDLDVALPVLAGERRAATLTPVGCRRGEPR